MKVIDTHYVTETSGVDPLFSPSSAFGCSLQSMVGFDLFFRKDMRTTLFSLCET